MIQYWVPIIGQKQDVRIVGKPFEAWQDWKMKGNGRWACYSYQSKSNAPSSAKKSWIIPVSIGGNVLLWRLGKIAYHNLAAIEQDPIFGNGKWEWFYDYDIVVEKTQLPNSQYPQTNIRVRPKPGAVIAPLTPLEEQNLFNEYWANAKQETVSMVTGSQPKDPPEEKKDAKVAKILKQMGYGKQKEQGYEETW